jgi:uncharacterized protein YjbJ (UPF0337 family)
MNKDDIKGKGNKIKGRTKQAVGDLTGDDRLKGEGAADEIKGGAQDVWGDVKRAGRDIKDDIEEEVRKRKNRDRAA